MAMYSKFKGLSHLLYSDKILRSLWLTVKIVLYCLQLSCFNELCQKSTRVRITYGTVLVLKAFSHGSKSKIPLIMSEKLHFFVRRQNEEVTIVILFVYDIIVIAEPFLFPYADF